MLGVTWARKKLKLLIREMHNQWEHEKLQGGKSGLGQCERSHDMVTPSKGFEPLTCCGER